MYDSEAVKELVQEASFLINKLTTVVSTLSVHVNTAGYPDTDLLKQKARENELKRFYDNLAQKEAAEKYTTRRLTDDETKY